MNFYYFVKMDVRDSKFKGGVHNENGEEDEKKENTPLSLSSLFFLF